MDGGKFSAERWRIYVPGYPVIDALDVHVAVLADLASGVKTIDTLNLGQP